MIRRRGFSLLELILALSLTVIVMGLIVSSIRLYMLQLEQRRVEIEQQHVSRGVIRMVSEDLRSAVQEKAQDFSALEDLIASQTLAGIGGFADIDEENVDAEDLEQQILDAVAAGGGTQGEPTDADGDEAGEEEDAEEDAEEEEEEKGRPTFIGTSNFIRLDVSRPLRLDEYNPLIVNQGDDQKLASDIKTITYFFSDQQPDEDFAFGGDFGKQGGLYRRQVDRAVESLRSGDQDIEIVVQPDEFSELVSPEISQLQFRYWNGENWLSEWDSVEMLGFPSAVEIVIVIDPERVSSEFEVSDFNRLEVETIRTVVHIPIAEIIIEETEDEGVEQ